MTAVTMSGMGAVAVGRMRELPTRILLALFIGVTAWFLAPGPAPFVWFAAVLAGQTLDTLVFTRFRRQPSREPTRLERVLCLVCMALNAAIYSALALYLWFWGGQAGQVFGLVQVSGSLLHVGHHLSSHRGMLLAGAIPHGLYFLGLPVASAIIKSEPRDLLILAGGLLYLAHLVAAVRRASWHTRTLEAARVEAETLKARAERANAAKSDFLAVISHEIRTPMNAVISAANLLRRTRLSHEQREHVDMLMDGGDVLVGLLNDVLDFSKIEAGKMELEAADMALSEKLKALGRLWEPKARAKGVDLTLHMADDLPEVVRTDPLRLQQILFNLLSNAVKFTEEGEIALTASWDANSSRLVVEVEDTGVGIRGDRIDSVFASFEQADAGTTRRFGGTGLGLSISRRLAQAMGGDLTVESEAGVGSLFRLELPVAVVDAGDAEAGEAEAEPVSLVGRSILAAEDHDVNRRILKLLLEPHGCTLTFAENGLEAVEAAEVQRFDAILMDMQMPVMDGLEATRRIRAAGANRDTTVLALTANALDTHRAAWDGLAIGGFLTKPIDPELLVTTLARACATRAMDARAAA